MDADNLLLLQGLPLDEDLTEEDIALLRRYSRTFTGSYSHTLDGNGWEAGSASPPLPTSRASLSTQTWPGPG